MTQLRKWAGMALPKNKKAEFTIRIVNRQESRQLNHKYRHKNQPTNILSFPLTDFTSNFIGDLVICAPLVKQEAHQQQKPLLAHWAHLIIHGVLHLLGYDHDTEKNAKLMETKETRILKKLNFTNPYVNK